MAIKKRPVSPRQKMINLMYVVLMAMLALNVSNEVLNGFSIVEESLNRTTSNAAKENMAIYEDFEQQMKANPQKVKEWYDKARLVRQMSDSLYNFAAELKQAIAYEADGKKGNPADLQNKEDLEAANQVMLAPGRGRGDALKRAIDSYRNDILKMIPDTAKQRNIASDLTTEVPKGAATLGKNWQEYMFESMPAAAAVTLLSKLQSDVRNAEKEVLHTLVQNIDVKDIRVNALEAFVIPNSQTIVRGDKFSAHIVMAAVDTTQIPDIYIGGQKVTLNDNLYERICGSTGDFTLAGYLETVNGNGDKIRRDFSQKYTVVDPSATVSADLMNVLYAGYNNPISVSVPGVPLNKISASMTNGSLQPVGPGRYIARPSKVGQDVMFTVTSTNTGRPQQMGQFTFRVRKLPDPIPYISMKDEHGNPSRYKGGGLAKSQLVAADGIGAAIDDGILDIAFRVQSFETVFFDNMGNAVPMSSEGASFSSRQKETFRKLSRNRRFYISRVTVVGPDGLTRTLQNPVEVIVK
ncbi:MAG: gliding motility protein GldM [Prevotella sp.]|nr:gliding motility protein GldM [Prevotella sp.]